MFRAGVLTVSDSSFSNIRPDTTGPTIKQILETNGFQVVVSTVVPDNIDSISSTLKKWADEAHLELVITTGGTGLSPNDVTPEATSKIIHRIIPGISEAIRSAGLKSTSYAMLSRGVAGIRSRCLIINLPGSPSAVNEGMEVIIPILEHAILKIKGDKTPCYQPKDKKE